jgi:hypothetical protein
MAVRDDIDAPARTGSTVSFLNEHIALLVPFVGVLIFAIRCLVVTRSDPFTAAALAAETSIGDAIRAIVLSGLQPLVYLIGTVCLWMATSLAFKQRLLHRGWGGPGAFLLLLVGAAAYMVYVYYAGGFRAGVYTGLMLTLFFVLSLTALPALQESGKLTEGRGGRWITRANYAWVVLVSVLIVGLSIGTSRFWLPPESFTFRGAAPLTGYLLKGNEDYLVIFEERHRIVIEKPKADLVTRNYCYIYADPLSLGSNARKYLPRCP